MYIWMYTHVHMYIGTADSVGGEIKFSQLFCITTIRVYIYNVCLYVYM